MIVDDGFNTMTKCFIRTAADEGGGEQTSGQREERDVMAQEEENSLKMC